MMAELRLEKEQLAAENQWLRRQVDLLLRQQSRRRGRTASGPNAPTSEPSTPKTPTAETQSNGTEPPNNPPPPNSEAASQPDPSNTSRRRGHGRNPADAYQPEKTVICNHESLRPGDRCPNPGCRGRLYDIDDPNVLIQLYGRPPITATRYEQQVLRCSACQDRFVAALPSGVAPEKYDATADAALALLKYGTGLPWDRLARLQAMVGVPLPPSTQFERCEAVADAAHPVYLELQRQAAGGEVICFDDTWVRILDCLKENQARGAAARTGLHTTGMVANLEAADGLPQVVLYESGRRHAGENIGKLINQRPPGLGPPILMADAEFKNWIGDSKRLVAKCLQHARRKFTEVEAAFPIETGEVLATFAAIYRNESQTRGMTPGRRLLYHQEHSAPIMAGLRERLEQQFAAHKVEPNSALGKAMQYVLNHWPGLTCFLREAGAPLDNNLAERVLKPAVLLRKNALFYKTQHGADVGGILMSLIQTCALNKVNPFEYLVALVRQAKEVRRDPLAWLPWNYRRRQEAQEEEAAA